MGLVLSGKAPHVQSHADCTCSTESSSSEEANAFVQKINVATSKHGVSEAWTPPRILQEAAGAARACVHLGALPASSGLGAATQGPKEWS